MILQHTGLNVSSILCLAGGSIPGMALKDRIKEAVDHFEDKGGKIPDLAAKLKVSRSAIYQWLDGSTKNLKNEVLFDLAKETGFSAEYIATGKGIKRVGQVSPDTETGPDLGFLTTTVQAVEEYLDMQELDLEPAAKAKLITLLYEICVDKGKIEAPAVARYLRLVA